MNGKIVFFDMDRTLIPVISSQFLCTEIGKAEKGEELERAVSSGEISDEDFTKGIGKLVRGHTIAQLREIYRKMPVIDGIYETVQSLKTSGFSAVIATAGVGEFAKFMCNDYGFEAYFGNSTILNGTIISGFGPPFIGGKDKARYIKKLCAKSGINPKQCVAVGDSMSDRHMFREVGKSIAINYSDNTKNYATHNIQICENLIQIMQFLE